MQTAGRQMQAAHL